MASNDIDTTTCPECGSNDTHSNGLDGADETWLCVGCGCQFEGADND